MRARCAEGVHHTSLSRAPRALVAALDHEEKTRHDPDVVTALPPAPARAWPKGCRTARAIGAGATFAVNLAGSFALGFLTGLGVSHDARLIVGTGLLGAYTRFSTWMVEAQRLGEDGDWTTMSLYLAGSMLAGVAIAGLGWLAGSPAAGSLDFDTAVPAAWRAVEPDAPELPAGGEGSPWVGALLERVRAFVREQGIAAPVVHVTLADGERFYLQAVEAGPGADMVTLHPYADRYDSAPPRAVIVPHRSIAKLELLVKPPRGTRSLVTLRRMR